MNVAERLEANAILDRLLDEEGPATFSVADAQRLIVLLPVTGRNWFGIEANWRSSGSATSGLAAGGLGEVSADDVREGSFKLGPGNELRIGGYKLHHWPGTIEIDHLWGDTREIEDQRQAVLRYKRPATPIVLELLVPKCFRLGPLSISKLVAQPWKTPAI
jgi:hypothetical protein